MKRILSSTFGASHRITASLFAFSLLGIAPSFAQTTAGQTVPGYYALAPQPGCSIGPCFIPYGPSIPTSGGPLTLTAAAVSAPGTGYVPGTDAGTVNGGIFSTQASLSITDTQLVAIVSVTAPGTGCTNGSGKTLTGTTGTGTKFQVSATAAANGITSVQSITVAGDYTVNPTTLSAEPVTGDSCTGAQLSITMGALKASVATAGNYTQIPSNPVSLTSTAGSGVNSTWTLTWNSIAPTGNTNVISSPGARTIIPLDVSTVTTGGTAVTTLTAGHRTAGGFLTNPKAATIDLCINEQGVASGTTTSGALVCIPPGGSYGLVPAAGAVSVITSDSSHPFGGEGLN